MMPTPTVCILRLNENVPITQKGVRKASHGQEFDNTSARERGT